MSIWKCNSLSLSCLDFHKVKLESFRGHFFVRKICSSKNYLVSTSFCRRAALTWAVIWGGAKRMGGGKPTRERALPEKFWTPPKKLLVCSVVDFCTGKKQSTDTRGGWKTYRTRGVQKPVLGGVSFVRFSTPLSLPPPHGVL